MTSQSPVRARPTAPARQAPGHFRPEIQALRAVAVVAVLVYHLWPGRLPGGFIGVDVFFVISGFLITGNMLREVERTGRLSLKGFWAGRARRILPAGLTTVVIATAASWALLPPSWWTRVKDEAFASVFYVENWTLARDAVDYLGAEGEPSPFQHFWSLGVEEQFYLLWPLLVAGAALIAARRARRGARGVLAGVFAPVAVASFAWSVIQVGAANPTAYFSTLTRLWELALGALLALIPASVRLPAALRGLATWAGLGAIVAGCFVIDSTMPFPGLTALPPTLGAGLVILGGPIPPRWGLKAISQWAPVQWIGNISYSLYLWHFPPIVIFTVVAERSPGMVWGPVLLAVSVAMAALSYYFVENPIRHSPRLRARSGLSLAWAGAGMVVAGAVALAPAIGVKVYEARYVALEVTTGLDSPFGAPAMEAGLDDPAFLEAKLGLVPSVLERMDVGVVPDHATDECRSEQFTKDVVRCEWTPPGGADHTVVLVGDSNARQYLPAMVELAPAMRLRLVTYLKQGCAFSSEIRVDHAERHGPCGQTNEETLQAIIADAPDLVVTAGRADKPFVDSQTGEVPGVAGFVDLWTRLDDAAIPVAVIRPTARIPGVIDCVTKNIDDPNRCAAPAGEQLGSVEQQIFDRALELAPFATDVDLRDYLCDDERCFAAVGNVIVYRDNTHITADFSRSLAGPMRPLLLRALGQ